MSADETTVKTVQQRIAADHRLAGAAIKVSVQGGTISLDGTVKTVAQKDKAEAIVRGVQQEKKQQPGVMDNLMVGG